MVEQISHLSMEERHSSDFYITQTSRLLALPAELRHAIWSFVLISPHPIQIQDQPDLLRPSLLRTCRCITKDTTGLYYSSNTFLLSFHPWDLDTTRLWLGSVVGPFHTSLIPKFRIQLNETAARCKAANFQSSKYDHLRDTLDDVARGHLHAFARELVGRGVRLRTVLVVAAEDQDAGDVGDEFLPQWMERFEKVMREALADADRYLVRGETKCAVLTQESMLGDGW